jgi:PPM family protein phosphatase
LQTAAHGMHGLRLKGSMATDVGRVRSHNEDKVLFIAPTTAQKNGRQDSLALVADGMGGHAAGEVASELAAEEIRRVFFELEGPVPKLLASALAAADAAIIKHAREHPECAGMGTTCSVVVVRDDRAWIAHVGDSRVYLLRGTQITQLTQDHTLVAKLVSDGTLTEAQAKKSEHGNVILQALGVGQQLQPQIPDEGHALLSGDIIILCSDGLHSLVPGAIISDITSRLPPLEACQALIKLALDAGGQDNISVGVFRVVTNADETIFRSDGTTRRVKPPAEIFQDAGGS